MYKVINDSAILRKHDGMCIPVNLHNQDYAAYITWLADGNTPEPVDVPNPNDAINSQIEALLTEYKGNRGSLQMEVYLLEKEAREYADIYGVPMAVILSGNEYYPIVKALDGQISTLKGQLM